MYLTGVKALTGEQFTYYFLCLENDYPWNVAVYKLSEESYNIGAAQFEQSLQNVRKARDSRCYRFQAQPEEI
jgi:hypothetical protein